MLEAYYIVKYSSSDQIENKWENKKENTHILRSETRNDIKIPKKPTTKCSGFSYFGAKLFNMLPCDIKEQKLMHFQSQDKKLDLAENTIILGVSII